MAALLNSLSFAFTNSFLPKYRVKYFDYIIKWCLGIYCNWCVSLDIAHILALNDCGLTTLETRRLRGDQIEVFKILIGYENIDSNIFLKLRKVK